MLAETRRVSALGFFPRGCLEWTRGSRFHEEQDKSSFRFRFIDAIACLTFFASQALKLACGGFDANWKIFWFSEKVM
jgi:hypothetical protein